MRLTNEINIINETLENLNICKEYYNSIYNNNAGCFQEYLNKIPTSYAGEIENDLNINLYSNIDIKVQQKFLNIFISLFLNLADFQLSIP